ELGATWMVDARVRVTGPCHRLSLDNTFKAWSPAAVLPGLFRIRCSFQMSRPAETPPLYRGSRLCSSNAAPSPPTRVVTVMRVPRGGVGGQGRLVDAGQAAAEGDAVDVGGLDHGHRAADARQGVQGRLHFGSGGGEGQGFGGLAVERQRVRGGRAGHGNVLQL